MNDLIYKKEVFGIIGAAIDVHRELGSGFFEAVYQEALVLEFDERGIPYESQKHLSIMYKGKPLTKEHIADFVCYEKIIIEIKSQAALSKKDKSQIVNYLSATGLRLGLLINFGSIGQLEWQRFIK